MDNVFALRKTDSIANYEAVLKSLEFVHHSLGNNVETELNSLINDSQNIDNHELQLRLSKIQDLCNTMKIMVGDTLSPNTENEKRNKIRYSEEIQKRLQVETVLHTLATTTSEEDSDNFFRYCLKTLADLYKCKYAFISLFNEENTEATTVAVWAEKVFVDNFTYELDGTPCADIANFKKELIPENASILYPDDEMLVQMGIESYFGAPLVLREVGVIGVVSVMDTKPMYPSEWTAPVLGTFASRIAVEVQRKKAFENIRQLNNTLEARIKERTSEIEDRNKELSAFTYTVSHDLRAPVRSIRSFSGIIKEDEWENLSEEGRQHLQRVINAGDKMSRMIDGLLVLSRMRRVELHYSNVNLSELFTEELNLLQAQEPTRKVIVVIAPHMYVHADRGLMQIVAQNLLSNAWKYSQYNADATITIGELEKDGKRVFYVKDTGIGFDIKYVNKLFEPFQRLHDESVYQGTGIGLASVHRIIKKHQGEIWAEAKPNEGATFYFTIPNPGE